MQKKILLVSFFAAFILLQNCQQDAPAGATFADNYSDDDASLLLLAADDPTALEKGAGSAFMLDNRGMMFFSVLDLSAEQKDSIHAIHNGYKDELRRLHRKWRHSETSWAQIKVHRDSIHTLIYQQVLTILTDEQLQLLEEIESQFANGEYPDALVAHRVAKLDEYLNLSDEQEVQIAELIKDYGGQLLQARDSSSDRKEFTEARKAIGRELNDAISALLTDEQLEMYKDVMKTKHKRLRHKDKRRHR